MSDYSSDSSEEENLEQTNNIRSKKETKKEEVKEEVEEEVKEEKPKPKRLNKNGKPRKPLTEKQKETLAKGRLASHARRQKREAEEAEIVKHNEVVSKLNNSKYNKNQKTKQHIEKAVKKIVAEQEEQEQEEEIVIKKKKPKKKVVIVEESSESEEEQIVYKKRKKKVIEPRETGDKEEVKQEVKPPSIRFMKR